MWVSVGSTGVNVSTVWVYTKQLHVYDHRYWIHTVYPYKYDTSVPEMSVEWGKLYSWPNVPKDVS